MTAAVLSSLADTWSYGAHPRDEHRMCPRCHEEHPHAFVGGTIALAEDFDLRPAELASDAIVERIDWTCHGCGTTYGQLGEARPDLGGEELGWVFARRAPDVGWLDSDDEPPELRSCERATVRP